MSTAPSLLSQLIADISKKGTILEDYLTRNGLPQPSFKTSAPIDLAIPASEESLIVGPAEGLKWIGMTEIYLLTSLQILCHFNIAQSIPLGSPIAFNELAKKTSLNESLLAHYLHMASTHHYFYEPAPGFAAHTAGSRLLAEDEGYRACAWLRADIFFTACSKALETMTRFGGSAKPEEAPYAVAFGDVFFAHLEKEPWRREKFAHSMKAMTSGSEVEEIAVVYDWGSVEEGGLVVDIGGGMAHISAAIATAHPHLHFLIQDLPSLADQANTHIASRSGPKASHLTFHPHDFFTPQPAIARNAAVYVLRNILHDWSDAHCQQILAHIVDAMGPKSRVVIVDVVVPEPGTLGMYEEAQMRTLDLTMWALFAARERSMEDWEGLLKVVDERLGVLKVVEPPRMRRYAVMEVGLLGEGVGGMEARPI
ncbi:S-adenosyl-L-methionine-dependent methyltransferase [Mytilinidion resinicola]|uniref:S-adenosyl-L-methionine-dependent methyltransferase n=1 Tax=Mytilinidion resinicola TaxID=574789 RepID=A0A6A6YJJ9_9PEZI|nr:S-adenosyl-L-methionine-dependent methyltransferase [Mytilinidion resinicola]KAF2808097.1 S-adenosyl-L-methionine-dependent methyltransferase [Mytilinidion resinicola]